MYTFVVCSSDLDLKRGDKKKVKQINQPHSVMSWLLDLELEYNVIDKSFEQYQWYRPSAASIFLETQESSSMDCKDNKQETHTNSLIFTSKAT